MKHDAVIVGAGPAGLKAAEILASNGKKVIVFEKNDVIGKKVCAGGLTKRCISLGIPSKLFEREFSSVKVHTKHFSTEITNKKPFIATIKREELGRWQMKNAEKAGAEVNINSEVKKIGNNYVIAKGKKVYFNYLIGADGSNSIVRKYIGIKTNDIGLGLHYIIDKELNDLEIFFDFKNFGQWYAWIFPHNGFSSVGTGGVFYNSSKLRKNLELFCRKKGIDISKARFEAALINTDYRGTNFGNKFLAGDAAGLASNLTEEGIYFAIMSGSEIARKIIDPGYSCPELKKAVEIKRRHERIAKLLMLNNTLTKIEHNLFVLLAKNSYFKNKFIDICC